MYLDVFTVTLIMVSSVVLSPCFRTVRYTCKQKHLCLQEHVEPELIQTTQEHHLLNQLID